MKQSTEYKEMLEFFSKVCYDKKFNNSDEVFKEALGLQLAFNIGKGIPLLYPHLIDREISQITKAVETVLSNGDFQSSCQIENLIEVFADIFNLTNFGCSLSYHSGKDNEPISSDITIKGEAKDGSWYGISSQQGCNQLERLIDFICTGNAVNGSSVVLLNPDNGSEGSDKFYGLSSVFNHNTNISFSCSIYREANIEYCNWIVNLDTVDIVNDLPSIATFYNVLLTTISEYLSRQTLVVKFIINNAYAKEEEIAEKFYSEYIKPCYYPFKVSDGGALGITTSLYDFKAEYFQILKEEDNVGDSIQ